MSAKRLQNGDYEYRGYILRNNGYHSPDKAIWWEAINKKTLFSDFHENTKRDLMKQIDEYEVKID